MTRPEARRALRLMLALASAIAVLVPTSGRAQQWRDGSARTIETRRMLAAAARLYGLDPSLLAAIAQVESADNPDAVSPKGAEGLMQLMPATAARFGVEDPFDPIENTLGAARFLSHLKQWQHDQHDPSISLPEMIAAYNAGEGTVEKYHGIPPYAETRQYVRKVLLTYLLDGPTHARMARRLVKFKPRPALAQPVILHPEDPLAQLVEIRRQRGIALSRQQQSPSRWPR
ncbi:MAG: lytic transglycosylase domain-containing protein [Candidatus Binataceae bacterium]